MSSTLVIQSHRKPLPQGWLQSCIDSVQAWTQGAGFEYRFVDDALFDLIDADLCRSHMGQPAVVADLARLVWIRQCLVEGYQRVIWCDADFLVFDADAFSPIDAAFALGREVWVQHDSRDRLRAYSKLHNAFMMFQRDNHLLDFYIGSAERLLQMNPGNVSPQFIGPKLVTALHNIVQFPVQENAGMLSPLVIRDLLGQGGSALDLFLEKSPMPLAAANLSASLSEREDLDQAAMSGLIDHLVEYGIG